jgi:hypothetical protein
LKESTVEAPNSSIRRWQPVIIMRPLTKPAEARSPAACAAGRDIIDQHAVESRAVSGVGGGI